jgi:hypothetical protein
MLYHNFSTFGWSVANEFILLFWNANISSVFLSLFNFRESYSYTEKKIMVGLYHLDAAVSQAHSCCWENGRESTGLYAENVNSTNVRFLMLVLWPVSIWVNEKPTLFHCTGKTKIVINVTSTLKYFLVFVHFIR